MTDPNAPVYPSGPPSSDPLDPAGNVEYVEDVPADSPLPEASAEPKGPGNIHAGVPTPEGHDQHGDPFPVAE